MRHSARRGGRTFGVERGRVARLPTRRVRRQHDVERDAVGARGRCYHERDVPPARAREVDVIDTVSPAADVLDARSEGRDLARLRRPRSDREARPDTRRWPRRVSCTVQLWCIPVPSGVAATTSALKRCACDARRPRLAMIPVSSVRTEVVPSGRAQRVVASVASVANVAISATVPIRASRGRTKRPSAAAGAANRRQLSRMRDHGS